MGFGGDFDDLEGDAVGPSDDILRSCCKSNPSIDVLNLSYSSSSVSKSASRFFPNTVAPDPVRSIRGRGAERCNWFVRSASPGRALSVFSIVVDSLFALPSCRFSSQATRASLVELLSDPFVLSFFLGPVSLRAGFELGPGVGCCDEVARSLTILPNCRIIFCKSNPAVAGSATPVDTEVLRKDEAADDVRRVI